MAALVNLAVHESQYPQVVEEDLKACLRSRALAHKFHYQSYRQAELWHALHRAHAPRNTDPSYEAIYGAAFDAAAEDCKGGAVQVAGLCCGYGEKELHLLRRLTGRGVEVAFLACDVSVPMVLAAAQEAEAVILKQCCSRLIYDVQNASDLVKCLPHVAPYSERRLFTCLGSIHNFEPELIFPRLTGLLRAGDLLLLSANLVPGIDYKQEVRNVLPQYENPPTFAWLTQVLIDLGFARDDGGVQATVETQKHSGLRRIVLSYCCGRDRLISLGGEPFQFCAGETIRLFYSYRFTAQSILERLRRCGLAVLQQWISERGEEGVFLCRLLN